MRFRVPVILVFALVSSAFAQVDVGGPTRVDDPAYPMKIRILTRNVSRSGYGAIRMWGRGDLFGPQAQGFDFESTCDEVLMVTRGDERYSARWKKQDHELELLVSHIGNDKPSKCTFKVDMRQFVYEYENGSSGAIVTHPMAP